MAQARTTPERFLSRDTALDIIKLYVTYMLITSVVVMAFYWFTREDVQQVEDNAAMLQSQGR